MALEFTDKQLRIIKVIFDNYYDQEGLVYFNQIEKIEDPHKIISVNDMLQINEMIRNELKSRGLNPYGYYV